MLSEHAEMFHEEGYAILRGAIEEEALASFEREFNAAVVARLPMNVLVAKRGLFCLTDIEQADIEIARFIDTECFLPSTHGLMLHDAVQAFFEAAGIRDLTCIQTLTYRYSSQQKAHSDYFLVSPPWIGEYDRDTLAASWIALEDADESNGALRVYPGSHKLEKKRLIEDFDGKHPDYSAYLEAMFADIGLTPRIFQARRGDILFWHGDFVHAGGVIQRQDATRLSLVSHYASIPPEQGSQTADRQRVWLGDCSYYGAGKA